MALAILALAGSCGDGSTPGVDANPDDLDGDGVPNATDDCPTRRDPAQHDEDGDGAGDACDNCPATANPGQADTTEEAALQFPDGVGDACDLRPAMGGDRIAAFYPFATEAEANAWTGSGWTIAGDALHATDTAAWSSKDSEVGDGVMVQVRATVTWLAPGAEVSAAVDGDGLTSGVACGVRRDADGDGKDELHARELTGSELVLALPDPLAPATPVTLTAWRSIALVGGVRQGRLICRVELAGARHELQVPTTDDLALGEVALLATGTQVEAASLVVYTSPPPKTN